MGKKTLLGVVLVAILAVWLVPAQRAEAVS